MFKVALAFARRALSTASSSAARLQLRSIQARPLRPSSGWHSEASGYHQGGLEQVLKTIWLTLQGPFQIFFLQQRIVTDQFIVAIKTLAQIVHALPA